MKSTTAMPAKAPTLTCVKCALTAPSPIVQTIDGSARCANLAACGRRIRITKQRAEREATT